MAKRRQKISRKPRRSFTKTFKQEAVQMMLDGHSASSVADRLGIENSNLLYRWKAELVAEGGPVAQSLDHELKALRDELKRTQRERDILKKALGILSQHD